MTRTIDASRVDQLYRAQPGGIGTYVRGLVQGLASLDDGRLDVVGRRAARRRARASVRACALRLTRAPAATRRADAALAALAARRAARSDRRARDVDGGALRGGAADAVHSVAMHDLLWRDEPGVDDPAGHPVPRGVGCELIARRDDLRVLHDLAGTRRATGRAWASTAARIHTVRLGRRRRRSRRREPAGGARRCSARTACRARSPSTRAPASRARTSSDWSRRTAPRARARPTLGPLVLVGPRAGATCRHGGRASCSGW